MRPHPRTNPAIRPAESVGRGRSSGSRGFAAIVAGTAAFGASALYFAARAQKAERRHPPVGRLLDVDGVRIHFEDRGEGPPVVLIHGNGTFVQDWELSGLAGRLLDAGHRVIILDRPGFGYTTRPRDRLWTGSAQAGLIAAFLRKLGVSDAVVVGHSWGTIVSLALALDHPGLVRGLVLLAGYYFPSRRLDVWLMTPPALPVIGDVMRYTVFPALARLLAPRILKASFAPRPIPQRFAERFPLELALRPRQLRASAADSGLMIPSVARLQRRYAELRMPVAIMTGDADRIVTARNQAFRLHHAIAHSSLRVFSGLGHMLHYFAGDEIVKQVRRLSEPEPEVRLARKPERAAAAPAL